MCLPVGGAVGVVIWGMYGVGVAHCCAAVRWVKSSVCVSPLTDEFIKYRFLPLVPTGRMNLF